MFSKIPSYTKSTTYYCYFSMISRKSSTDITSKQQAQLGTCVTGPWMEVIILSMTCHATWSSPFWSEVLGPLTNSQLCLAYNFNSVLPLIPCLSLGSFSCSLMETLTADSPLPAISTPPLRLWIELHHRQPCWINTCLDL